MYFRFLIPKKLKNELSISFLPAVGLGSHRTESTDWPNSPRFVLQDNCECKLIFLLLKLPMAWEVG